MGSSASALRTTALSGDLLIKNIFQVLVLFLNILSYSKHFGIIDFSLKNCKNNLGTHCYFGSESEDKVFP